jgi:hypothetical protein
MKKTESKRTEGIFTKGKLAGSCQLTRQSSRNVNQKIFCLGQHKYTLQFIVIVELTG